ncbi:MAG TPA: C-GCAxxG-C-C family protein [Anaerolineales bacterium]|nr:C-GCAxxG-C-C family protein [Anaerolineales bacterium]
MSQKTDLARRYHERGFNCAQSVLAPFAGDYGLDEPTALRISTGFGSGMGRLCEVCGALTGAFMVIGLKHGRQESDGTKYGPKTENTYRLVTELAARFRQRNNSIYCRDLVGHDLSIPEERENARQAGVFTAVCSKCIEDATDLAEKALGESETV